MTLMCQRHALGVSAEQANADFLFQLLDRQGQGRLGNERRLRGGGDRAGFGHGDEVTDLTQGHHPHCLPSHCVVVCVHLPPGRNVTFIGDCLNQNSGIELSVAMGAVKRSGKVSKTR